MIIDLKHETKDLHAISNNLLYFLICNFFTHPHPPLIPSPRWNVGYPDYRHPDLCKAQVGDPSKHNSGCLIESYGTK